MPHIITPDSEELGRKRFYDNKSYRRDLNNRTTDILSALRGLLPSNYPNDSNTNLSQLFQILGREFARLNLDIDYLNSDKEYTTTRVQFLEQILGERLFLSERIAPKNYNDESYRNYLIALKNAYLVGSLKSNIEKIASSFTGLDIRLKELYLEARKPNSSYGVSDTHKMVVDILVDNLVGSNVDIAQLHQDLNFFINLVRPAHVLYDTNLIWTETIDVNKVHDLIFGDTGGGCVPVYDFAPFGSKTILALQVFVQDTSEGATGVIDSIHHNDLVFYLDDETKVVVEPGSTIIFNKNGKRVPFSNLHIGDYVRINFIEIPGKFQFWWLDPELALNPNSWNYKSVYQKPIFQEFVKKVMDSKGRFPLQIKTTPTTICDRWVQDLLVPVYEDLRKQCSQEGRIVPVTHSVILSERMGYPRLSWPYPPEEIHDPVLLGSDFIFGISDTPLTDGAGNPAAPADISVFFDGTFLPSAVISVDASSGRVELTDSSAFWDASIGRFPVAGEELDFHYYYLPDGSDITGSTEFVSGIRYWQMPSVPLTDALGNLADSTSVIVSVDGTEISTPIVGFNPLLGHVVLNGTVNFWQNSELGRIPEIGDEFKFQSYQANGIVFTLLFDEPGRVLDGYQSSFLTYGMVFDGVEGGDPEKDSIEASIPLEIGYRYRAYLLHHSSVLNSPDTLLLNNYQKPAKRASLKNQQDSLNHFNTFFSGEFLEDTNPNILLNDQYLENGLDPVLKLREGTPPFQKTFSYHPDLIYHRKLQDIREHRSPLLYSDLLLKEFELRGESVPLSSICDTDRATFRIRFTEDPYAGLQECEPWILFDTVESETIEAILSGSTRGRPNLRVPGIKLRDNFVLRDREPEGVASYTHTVITPSDVMQTAFYMPETIPYVTEEGETVGFPSLPLMKDVYTLATSSDVVIMVNGSPFTGTVIGFDATTGYIELDSIPQGATVTFTYNIINVRDIEITDLNRSRILDYIYVFGGVCPDPIKMTLGIEFQEYVNFLDDYSHGIRVKYFNKDTFQVEEHIFSGPVFEIFNKQDDEIGSPDSFTNALVRIRSPIHNNNPLVYRQSFDFLGDAAVRFRKKTFKELLPDRTFRNIEIREVLPV